VNHVKVTLGYLFCLILACGTAHAQAPKGTARPNIIMILADDLGCMDVGAFNPKTFYETPNLDALAKRGMRFQQAYAACCVCSPTRGSIMTGKYPPRFGITDFIPGAKSGKVKSAPNGSHLALSEVTIAEALRDGGYETFFAGKWHLGGGEFSPSGQGFPKNLVNGVKPNAGNQFWYPASGIAIPDAKDDPKTTQRIANETVHFIQTKREVPFFAYLPFLAPHIPVGAKQELIDKYLKKAMTVQGEEWGQEGASRVRLLQNQAKYAAMVEEMDSAIGQIIAAVDAAGQRDNTVIVFTSDNGGLSTAEGWHTSNLPLRAGKGWAYEGGIREPLIVCAPNITKPGSTCDTPVMSTDFYPTFLELAGLPLQPKQHLDGVSMLPLLKGDTFKREVPLYWHYPHYSNQGGGPHGAIRDGDWKLIEFYEDNTFELYNIALDGSEKNNLVAMEAKRAEELKAKLVAWRKEVGALMPTPLPAKKP
jgi:arylsulfatase A-like enzyme